jgi:hypothetical protein
MEERLLERYLKVKALAERGDRGEKTAAGGILKQLEKKHPGIREAALALEASRTAPDPFSSHSSSHGTAQRTAQRRSREPNQQGRHSSYHQHGAPEGPSAPGGNWENIFSYVSAAYDTVNQWSEILRAAEEGKEAAEEAEFEGYHRKSVFFVRARFPRHHVHRIRGMNAAQKDAYRKALHEKLDVYISALLGESRHHG